MNVTSKNSKLPILSGYELNKILSDLRFKHIRTKGSHKVLRKNKHILIIPLHKELKKGTLKEIVKASADILCISYKEARKLLADKKLRKRYKSFLCS